MREREKKTSDSFPALSKAKAVNRYVPNLFLFFDSFRQPFLFPICDSGSPLINVVIFSSNRAVNSFLRILNQILLDSGFFLGGGVMEGETVHSPLY